MSALSVNFHRVFSGSNRRPKQLFIAGILLLALIAFELFNFDTTRFALENLLGGVLFLGIGWATILAIAFCGIDLAGLVRLFTPQQGKDEPREVWYLMGAWLLGATMNAVMTWWAVSVTLLNNNFGNEVLSREQLLRYVPIFVAVLVWLTRILFIGSLSMAGDHLFGQRTARRDSRPAASPALPSGSPKRSSRPAPAPAPVKRTAAPATMGTSTAVAPPVSRSAPVPAPQPVSPRQPVTSGDGRVKQRPPRPGMRPNSLSAGGRPTR